MDCRSALISTPKPTNSQRNSVQNVTTAVPKEGRSAEDVEYQLVRMQITASHYYKNANQHVRIRLNNWLSRLDRISKNKVWVSNRNNYIKLLNLMCHCEYIIHPFIQLPPQGDLLNLRKHDITKIIDQLEREIKTSRFTSRKNSIAENSDMKTFQTMSNFTSEIKRFKTETNTCGEDESDTIPLRNFIRARTFETDFEDKTISFNLSTEQNYLSRPIENCEEEDEGLDCFQAQNEKHSRSNSQANKSELKELQHYENRIQNAHGRSVKKVEKNRFKKQSKPPLYKQIRKSLSKENEAKREYWESNQMTGNNSGTGTPKYLDKYQWSVEKSGKEVQIVSHRDGEGQGCDCTGKVLGESWLSQLIRKIIA